MAVVYIPALMRDLTSGQDILTVSAVTVSQLLDRLEAAYPGIKSRLCDGESLRPGLAVAVDGQLATRGLSQPIADTSEVHFLPAIAGGTNDHNYRKKGL